jgi:hypothetical protein
MIPGAPANPQDFPPVIPQAFPAALRASVAFLTHYFLHWEPSLRMQPSALLNK